nr:spore cortex-lytic enzyme [bacterium]
MKHISPRHIRLAFSALALLLIACVLLSSTTFGAVVLLRRGSTGEQVRQLQTKLKDLGYYTGSIDGIFGSKTDAAVRAYQRKMGLVVDGIVGPATAGSLGITLADNPSPTGDVYLLARVVYSEARGEPYEGQVAVAAVVLNRIKSPSFPNTMSGVVYQAGAFSSVADGQINLAPDDTAIRAARDALNGWDPTNGCLYYYNPAKTTNKWMLSLPVYLSIGRHNFCR